ncbi:TetR family transcriptional regulator C-terminal domain-containing protein [Marinomonas sp. RSW2]|jgi:TetR/AcrR family transcriptional regulator|uniref:TetR family transcriptional regulator C-terminal domain-containing protein n=1 Tax=Marinomonas maritima TaxID=2940935 RepID=A0ABT5WCK3_9GAMM|nr:TetR family transcriptional regulator C-terminal domain-containing protein [Marinomonas maritima]MDE8602542.1 TetR family transcriptional regulator C-terminal domain-containing protein [Marinomonas maritima]
MSKRQNHREEVFVKILEAAEIEFGLKGYSGASLQHIAERAGLPKPNIIYYFQSKANLYKQVLDQTLMGWNDLFDRATIDDDPAYVLDSFIRVKLKQSFDKGATSRLFAMEVIGGALHIGDYLKEELRPWFMSRVALLQSWMDAGKMRQCDPASVIYMIWSSTQHYADFEAQVLALSGIESLTDDDLKRIGDTVSGIILAGCGLSLPSNH